MSVVKAWKSKSEVMFKTGVGEKYPHLQQPRMHRVVVAQLLATVCLSLLLLPLGKFYAISALSGGLACSIPNAFLVWRAFRYRGASAAQKIARSFYQGEAGKFVLTVLAFILIFTLVPSIEPLALFGAFALIQAVNWLTPLLIKS
ncbi:ATP synthase subunit I [Endozoicomonas arenosclerae]|uniref:ATP synthase subunit I n=1 Tax=Endozoicomonas arenosclerae TaxID=1633495 RepID=UPI0007837DE5|nr:ATP synthase subunit I [Endozoicomonas arenosclerae]